MGDYHHMPLALTSDIKKTYEKFRTEISRHSETVRIETDENLEISARGLGGNDHFYFHVFSPEQNINKSKIDYSIEFSPKNTSTVNAMNSKTTGTNLQKLLTNWIGYLKRYNEIQIHPTDSIDEQYEQEFDDWFEIVDDDADTNAFNAEQQLLIQNIIDKSVTLLIKEGVEEDDPVIKEANWLKSKLGTYTKRQVVQCVKKIYPKLRKKGLDMTKKVYDIWTTEMIAMGYRETIHGLGEFLASNLIG